MGPGLGAKDNNNDNEASEPETSELNDNNEMPMELTLRPRLSQEIFTTPEMTTPEHNIATTTATTWLTTRSTTTTITVNAIQTTSADEENNDCREVFNDSNEHNITAAYIEEIESNATESRPRKLPENFDRRPTNAELHRDDFNKWIIIISLIILFSIKWYLASTFFS